jgi:hypothetical protein
VTDGDGHTIRELGGEPALPALRGAIEGLAPSERAMIANGLLLGIVLNGARRAGGGEEPSEGFLVRGLIGADPEAGTVSVGAEVEPGTVVRLHARDATRPTATCARRSGCGSRRSAATAGGAPWSSPATGAAAGCSASPTTTPRRWPVGWPGRPRRGSSPPARSARWADRRSCTGFTATVAVFPG